ncbi:MAG: diguanylate cyclase [Nitrososphaerota archaeon]
MQTLQLLEEIRRITAGEGLPAQRLTKALSALREARGYYWIGIYRKEGSAMVRKAFSGPLPPCDVFPLGVGNVGWVGMTGLPKLIPDVRNDPQYSMCFVATKSELVVPLKSGEEVVGLIDVESDRPHYFTEADLRLLQQAGELLLPLLLQV